MNEEHKNIELAELREGLQNANDKIIELQAENEKLKYDKVIREAGIMNLRKEIERLKELVRSEGQFRKENNIK